VGVLLYSWNTPRVWSSGCMGGTPTTKRYSHVGVFPQVWEYSHNEGVFCHCGNTPTMWEYSHIEEHSANVGILPQCGSPPIKWEGGFLRYGINITLLDYCHNVGCPTMWEYSHHAIFHIVGVLTHHGNIPKKWVQSLVVGCGSAATFWGYSRIVGVRIVGV
jgi:hypothetical protein